MNRVLKKSEASAECKKSLEEVEQKLAALGLALRANDE